MIAILTKKLLANLRRKSYREAYVEENVRTGFAYQVRALREQRGWSQKKLAEILHKPQSVLSRIEDPDYGKLSVQTLLELAAAFDVALLLQFVPFPDFIERTRDVSPEALRADSFSEGQFIALEGSSRTIGNKFNALTFPLIFPAAYANAGTISSAQLLAGVSTNYYGYGNASAQQMSTSAVATVAVANTPFVAPTGRRIVQNAPLPAPNLRELEPLGAA